MLPKDLFAGMKLYEWTLIQKVPDNPNHNTIMRNRWRVECSCGVRQTLPAYYLLRKTPKTNCGHLRKSIKTHFKTEYGIWHMMHQRCYNANHVAYKHYGGRGICICDSWRDPETGFETFLKHVGPRPSMLHSIDRFPNNDGNYEPGNVRWATAKEQRANQRPRKDHNG